MRIRRGWLAALGLASLVGAGEAAAVSVLDVTLDVRFGSRATGHFARLSIEETGDGGLEFTVRLLEALGSRADMDELYFNLPSSVRGLEVETLGDVETPFEVETGPSVHGGAGSDFDVAVSFGSGRGRNGNGQLQVARFVLRADQPLSLAALLAEASETSQGIESHFAVHTQGSRGGGSTVGGFVIPEPATALLAGTGLLGLALFGRRRL